MIYFFSCKFKSNPIPNLHALKSAITERLMTKKLLFKNAEIRNMKRKYGIVYGLNVYTPPASLSLSLNYIIH